MAQDLGHLLPTFPLTAGSSMAEGNTVSDAPFEMKGPGSPSEQTEMVVPRPATAAQPSGPEQPVGTPAARAPGGMYDPSPASWTETPNTGHMQKESP